MYVYIYIYTHMIVVFVSSCFSFLTFVISNKSYVMFKLNTSSVGYMYSLCCLSYVVLSFSVSLFIV